MGLEFANGEHLARLMVSEWKRAGEIGNALRSLDLDRWYFIPTYTIVVLALGLWGRGALRPGSKIKPAIPQAQVPRPTSQRLATYIALLILVTAVSDYVEDWGLRKILTMPGRRIGGYLTIVHWATGIKLASFSLALVWGLATSFFRVARAIDRYLDKPNVKASPRAAEVQVSPKDRPTIRPRLLAWLIGSPSRSPVPPKQDEKSPPDAQNEGRKPKERVGICCSGGGIRSAAYNLGALQSLQRNGTLQKADYLAAVSGGAYIAASMTMVKALSKPQLLKESAPYAPGSPEEHYLRNHSSYLAPPGVAGKAWMVLRTLVGIAISLGFVALLLFLVARPIGWINAGSQHRGLHCSLIRLSQPSPTPSAAVPERSLSSPCVSAHTGSQAPLRLSSAQAFHALFRVTRWMWVAALVPALLGLVLVVAELLTRSSDLVEQLLRAWGIRLIDLGVVVFLGLIGVPFLIAGARVYFHAKNFGIPKPTVTLPVAGIGSMLVGMIRTLVARHRSWFAYLAGAIVGPVGLGALFLAFTSGAALRGIRHDWSLELIALAAFILFILFADLTAWSPHPFYKRALWGSFGLVRETGPSGSVAAVPEYDDQDQIAQINPRGWPELIVCAAANVSDEGATPPGRYATTFTFTHEEIGGPMITYQNSADFAEALRSRKRDISLISAVAISGAAISPSMGKMTRRPIRFLMGLLNIRLGVWLPNPAYIEYWKELATRGSFHRFVWGHPRPVYYLRELVGSNRLSSKFLYVSDGGHYENLGLVELLRRGCTEIYCFDASGDEDDTFFTLGEAIELARAELQVEIEIQPEDMGPLPEGVTGGGPSEANGGSGSDGGQQVSEPGPPKKPYCGADVKEGSIIYPGREKKGRLFYAKAAVTINAPWDVKAFYRKNRRFPHNSTVDQFFNEEKFEAYRTLGAHTATRLLALRDSASQEHSASSRGAGVRWWGRTRRHSPRSSA